MTKNSPVNRKIEKVRKIGNVWKNEKFRKIEIVRKIENIN